MPHDRVAVVIPAHDAAGLLRDCLESVIGQLLPDDELVVVDDRSTDATLSVCAEVGVRVVPNTHAPGPYGARNCGVGATDAELLVFFDSRCRARPGWLDHHRRALAAGSDPVITYSDVAVRPGGSPAGAIAAHMNPFGTATYRGLGFFPACNLGVSRRLWASVGGFPEVRSGGDETLCRRAVVAGARLDGDSTTRVDWTPRERFGDLLSQYHRYGRSSYDPSAASPLGFAARRLPLLPIRALGTFVGPLSRRSRFSARMGAAAVQAGFEVGGLRAAAAALRSRTAVPAAAGP
ncbi:glycosyltransferase [Williamsia deligens]|uniref:Glycosyltransferase n=1 Tax=Williamsia deligens TaxID=321325 RepID=A0ABW3G6S4_9NOCA|nr:glycosyltransferase family 2 protein [Williamsia deligens]MCP2193266.1 Glycosyl transferase family 2 [Williamsia deligens]